MTIPITQGKGNENQWEKSKGKNTHIWCPCTDIGSSNQNEHQCGGNENRSQVKPCPTKKNPTTQKKNTHLTILHIKHDLLQIPKLPHKSPHVSLLLYPITPSVTPTTLAPSVSPPYICW